MNNSTIELPKDLDEVLRYHFNDYSKEMIIEALIERIPKEEQLKIYHDITGIVL